MWDRHKFECINQPVIACSGIFHLARRTRSARVTLKNCVCNLSHRSNTKDEQRPQFWSHKKSFRRENGSTSLSKHSHIWQHTKNVNVSQAEAIRVIEYAIISGEHFYFPFRWEDSREYFFMLEAYWKATITKRDEFATLIWSALLCEQRLKRNWGRNFLDPKSLESIMKAELPGFICKRERERARGRGENFFILSLPIIRMRNMKYVSQ